MCSRDTAFACVSSSGNDFGTSDFVLDQGNSAVLNVPQANSAAIASDNNGASVLPLGTINFNQGACTAPVIPTL